MDKDRNPTLHDAMGDLTFVGVVGNINGFVEVTTLFEPKISVTDGQLTLGFIRY